MLDLSTCCGCRVFIYLNDVSAGGETAFPRAAGDAVPSNQVLDCTRGVAVRPQTHKMVLFYSLMPRSRSGGMEPVGALNEPQSSLEPQSPLETQSSLEPQSPLVPQSPLDESCIPS